MRAVMGGCGAGLAISQEFLDVVVQSCDGRVRRGGERTTCSIPGASSASPSAACDESEIAGREVKEGRRRAGREQVRKVYQWNCRIISRCMFLTSS
eukprot:748417-Hanusia_phi.AAC.2